MPDLASLPGELHASHYRQLLSEAGVELTAQYEQPLDVVLRR